MKESSLRLSHVLWLVSINIGLLPGNARAKEGYQYPELLVVPKASQEIAQNAATENKTRYSTHVLLQAPAFLTLTAGLMATSMKSSEGKDASLIATSVGAGWLLGTWAMSAYYTPYRNAQQELSSMPEKTLEQTLAKERRAEEGLYAPAYIMRRVQYIAAVTNFAAAIGVATVEEENTKAQAVALVAAAAAFLPIVFDHPWIAHYDQQQDYKKRIYGPLTQVTLLQAGPGTPWVPGIDISMRF